MTVLWEIDPTSEDATNTPLSLVGVISNVNYRLVEMDLTPPEIDATYAASADTEGDPYVTSRFRNRTISLGFIATATTDAVLQTGVQSLQQKLEKLRREGGTLKMTTQAGTTTVGDVLFASFKPVFEPELYSTANHGLRFTLDFECEPFFRGAAVQQADHVETTLPHIVFTETGIGGDVPALGRLVVDNDDATNDQLFLFWGLRSRYYDAATTAALFYQAEALTPQSGAAIGTRTGASGGGSNNVISTGSLELSQRPRSMLSTQMLAASHLTHVGNYVVWARVYASTTSSRLALSWAYGDFAKWTLNGEVQPGVAAGFSLVNLGQITIPKATVGTQKWEGRILARADGIGGASMEIDCLWIVPAEGYGETRSVTRFSSPVSMNAQDDFFSTTAGNALNARVASLGGTWATSGAATDLVFADGPGSGEETVTRTATGARFAILGATSYTNIQVGAFIRTAEAPNVGSQRYGVIARYVDSSNYLFGGIYPAGNTGGLAIFKVVAGVETLLANTTPSIGPFNRWWDLRLAAYTSGRVVLLLYIDAVLQARLVANDTVIATAGTLQTGKVGFVDNGTSSTAARYYDNFFASTTESEDVAVFASRSLRLEDSQVIREDAAGGTWGRPGSYQGDYLNIPPAGKESRTTQIIVKASRNLPESGAQDAGIDDISARLTVTPRFLVLPS